MLLTDETGELLETDRANVFAVIDGVLLTPPADGRLLPGTTRAAVLRAAHAIGVRTGQKPLTLDELAEASEVFVTNAVVGVLPVRAVTGVRRAWPSARSRPRSPRRSSPVPPTARAHWPLRLPVSPLPLVSPRWPLRPRPPSMPPHLPHRQPRWPRSASKTALPRGSRGAPWQADRTAR